MSSISWALPAAPSWGAGPRTSPPPTQALAQGAVLFHSQGSGWRLVSGCLRLDRTVGATRQLVQLALPGDWVGLEALCGEGYRLQAQALTPCTVEALDPDSVHTWTWAKAWLQQQHRHVQMTQLRTGKVASRLAHLLELLALPCAAHDGHATTDPDALRPPLPPLRVLAEVVDAQPETVCRALSKLWPHTARGRASAP
ncbi:Crp/Fnr family transcriptional regulator [Aquabacterium sp. A08]|nr:Crp/Fnr family transcriptional regulator [Aquabacterium sp. A08]